MLLILYYIFSSGRPQFSAQSSTFPRPSPSSSPTPTGTKIIFFRCYRHIRRLSSGLLFSLTRQSSRNLALLPTRFSKFYRKNPFFLGLKRDMDHNSRNRISFFAVLLFVGLFSIRVHSIRFDLQSGHTKCISEDIKSNSMTVGKYHIVNASEGHPLPDSHKVTVRVTSSYGNNYHYADHVQTGQFAFQTGEAGDYMACFFAADHNPSVTVTVDFDWKSGVAAKDWSNVAKKGSVELMELELKKMYDTVQSIHDEMFYLREREEEMQELNRSTNSKMGWLSVLSLFIALSVSGLQLWHLKTFFEKKKLI